jgi:MoxR-like ATPase
MPEKIRFKSPEELKEEEIERKIKEKGPEGEIVGGIVFEEEIDSKTGEKKKYIYIGDPYKERPIVTKLETEATKEEIEAIKKEIIPMKESFEILETMARTYKHRQPLLIEGPTAIGKTYLANKFTEMLYGRGVKPLDFYCSGQTDVSELMAKWVPKVETEEEKRKWNEFLESTEAQIEISKIAQEVEQKQGLSQEQKLALIHSKLQELAKSAGLSEKTQWRFQYGAVPKAMGLIRNPDGSFSFDEQKGVGFILHIEEVGLAEPQVINALLKLRGKRGQLAEEIQLWENGGRKIKAGPKFWVYFSTNPPEEYLARNEVDPALARGVVFKRMTELSEESLRLAANYCFTYRLGGKPKEKPEGCILDIYNHPEIGEEIAKVVSAFHNDLNKELKKGEKGRQQRIPLTLDDMTRIADALIDEQIRDKETGRLDLTKSLRELIRFYYLDRLADEGLKETMMANLDKILGLSISKNELEAIKKSEKVLKSGGKELPPGFVLFEGEILTRKEFFDILVERASLSKEEKERLKVEEEKRKQRESQLIEYNINEKINKLKENTNIPEYIKKLLE